MPDWSATPPTSHDPEDALNELFASVPTYEPDEHIYCWVYRIRIENAGSATLQLSERTWHITDGQGRTEYVHGEGVVGEQPVIRPQAGFDYTSGVSLTTPGGFMRGSYQMRDINSGRRFDIAIPAFSLDSPFQIRQIH